MKIMSRETKRNKEDEGEGKKKKERKTSFSVFVLLKDDKTWAFPRSAK